MKLDWSKLNITVSTKESDTLSETFTDGVEIHITTEISHRQELSEALKQLVASEATHKEVTLVLNPSWVLYWKIKPGTTRLSVAHPTEKEWVGTIHYSETAMSKCAELLLEEANLSLNSIGTLNPLTNFQAHFIKK